MQARTYFDDAYFAQPAFTMPRENDVDIGCRDIRVIHHEGMIVDELTPSTAHFWVASDAIRASEVRVWPSPPVS